MTALDHSSAASLFAGLDRHRDGLFRFDYGVVTSQLWHLKYASLETSVPNRKSGIRLWIKYVKSSRGADEMFFWLDNGWLVCGSIPFGVVVVEDGPPQGGSSDFVDESQQRLNDNLRGVFA